MVNLYNCIPMRRISRLNDGPDIKLLVLLDWGLLVLLVLLDWELFVCFASHRVSAGGFVSHRISTGGFGLELYWFQLTPNKFPGVAKRCFRLVYICASS